MLSSWILDVENYKQYSVLLERQFYLVPVLEALSMNVDKRQVNLWYYWMHQLKVVLLLGALALSDII